MSSSRPQDRSPGASSPIAKVDQFSSEGGSKSLPPSETGTIPGSLNDQNLVQQLVTSGMKRSGLSRAEIADRMCYLLGLQVTEAMLNNFAADSRPDVRFPLSFVRAFCAAVGDSQLLRAVADLAGLHVVDETGLQLMELGREYLREKRAAENRDALERKLRGVDL